MATAMSEGIMVENSIPPLSEMKSRVNRKKDDHRSPSFSSFIKISQEPTYSFGTLGKQS